MVPCCLAFLTHSITSRGVVSLSAAKMPPVCNQRTPSLPKIWSQSKSPGLSWLAAVLPRSGMPTAPRTPKPRSVKFSPLRTTRPTPSNGAHLMKSVSTPPCKMKSSMSRPTSLSANAVATAVLKPKQRRSPRATLYSPPPSHTLNSRAQRTRPSPGSSRSMISPSAIRSYLQEPAGLMFRAGMVNVSAESLNRYNVKNQNLLVVVNHRPLAGDDHRENRIERRAHVGLQRSEGLTNLRLRHGQVEIVNQRSGAARRNRTPQRANRCQPVPRS